jgi:hypothetical protein
MLAIQLKFQNNTMELFYIYKIYGIILYIKIYHRMQHNFEVFFATAFSEVVYNKSQSI